MKIQVFDPGQDYAVVERRLPHWSQAGTITFITWRTWDSIPESVLAVWMAEWDVWLERHGIDSRNAAWEAKLKGLSDVLVREYHHYVSDRWNDLDACHGECVLRRPEFSKIVADSLRHFDRVRYELTDFVVMPNHVHILAAFPSEEEMLKQCESWKHFTARQINQALGKKRRFWQQDGFDHLVRSAEQFQHLRRYIADNPVRARLQPGEYVYEAKAI